MPATYQRSQGKRSEICSWCHHDPGLVLLGLSHPPNLKQPKNMVPNKEYRSNTKPEFRLGLWKCNWIWLGDGICPSQTARALFWAPGTLPLALGGSGWQALFFSHCQCQSHVWSVNNDWTTSQADGLVSIAIWLGLIWIDWTWPLVAVESWLKLP